MIPLNPIVRIPKGWKLVVRATGITVVDDEDHWWTGVTYWNKRVYLEMRESLNANGGYLWNDAIYLAEAVRIAHALMLRYPNPDSPKNEDGSIPVIERDPEAFQFLR